MTVTARFFVNEIIDHPTYNAKTVHMCPVTSGPGNESYSKATPSGSFEMYITNPGAFDQFAKGDVFDITLEKNELQSPKAQPT